MTNIGYEFLFCCETLCSVSMPGMKSLGKIRGSFIVGSVFLDHVDIDGMSSVKSIGFGFMKNNVFGSLKINGMSSLTAIGERFLYNSNFLWKVELNDMGLVTTIDGEFMAKCPMLSHLDLTAMKRLKTVESTGFLRDCDCVNWVDFSGLTELQPFECMGEMLEVGTDIPGKLYFEQIRDDE